VHSHYLFLALELARERAAVADAERLASLGRSHESVRTRARRGIARVAVAIARAADEESLEVSFGAR
jgi:hypothetical protein